MGGMSTSSKALSGGEMQRIALWVNLLRNSLCERFMECRSRTFMRSLLSSGANVGLLLFDEPSASLDPTAEHGMPHFINLQNVWYSMGRYSDLFLRLRQLRGNKTMVFSSHRFGNLTRHADLILWVSYTCLQRDVYNKRCSGTCTGQESSKKVHMRSCWSVVGSMHRYGISKRRHSSRRCTPWIICACCVIELYYLNSAVKNTWDNASIF